MLLRAGADPERAAADGRTAAEHARGAADRAGSPRRAEVAALFEDAELCFYNHSQVCCCCC